MWTLNVTPELETLESPIRDTWTRQIITFNIFRNMNWSGLVCVLAGLLTFVAGDTLEVMEDVELEKLIQQEKYVIVLFGQKTS